MGMSIDEAIPILHDMYNYYNNTDSDAYVGFDNEDNNAIKTALDTMQKYQKIKQIVEDRYGKPIFKFMDAIVKVVEDGNVDC